MCVCMYKRDYIIFWDSVWIKVIYIFNLHLFFFLLLFYRCILSDEALKIALDDQYRIMFSGVFFLSRVCDLKSEEHRRS